jgi:hypothetical protein
VARRICGILEPSAFLDSQGVSMVRQIFVLGAVAVLAACNSNTDATDRARSDALAQTICAQRGITPGDSRYDACRNSSVANRTLVESTSAITYDSSVPPTGDILMNPYSTRPQRGVYGPGI